MYGLSASPDGRTDGSNRAIEALFGPIMEDVTYREAVAEGYVPEVETFFYRHPMTEITSSDPKVREGTLIINNPTRNHFIKEVCEYWEAETKKRYDREPQILVLVNTAEHAIILHRMMPEYTAIFKTINQNPRMRLLRAGYTPEECKSHSTDEVIKMQQGLTNGTIKRAVAVASMGTGVDTKHLDVLVRADGGKSPVSNIQFRGRVTRGTNGVYVDFFDHGQRSYERNALARYKDALSAGWKIRVLDFKTGRETPIVLKHKPGRSCRDDDYGREDDGVGH
jgi:superfamily II DNA or RNA helicase